MRLTKPILTTLSTVFGLAVITSHHAHAEHGDEVACSAHLNCYEMGVSATDLKQMIEKHPDPHMGISLQCYTQAETPEELKTTVEAAQQTDANMGLSVQCYTSGQ